MKLLDALLAQCGCRDPDVVVESDHPPIEPLWVVRCRSCSWHGTHEDTKAEAIAAWNKSHED